MKKNKKSILLFFGLLIFSLFITIKYTDVFVIKNAKSYVPIDGAIYDYVKSFNMNSKTRISYPVFHELNILDSSNEFCKFYLSADGLYLSACIEKNNNNIDSVYLSKYNEFKNQYNLNSYKFSSSDIKCDNYCQRYKVSNTDGSLVVDELRIFLNSSTNELFELVYHSEGKELSPDLINAVINNIIITHDATYYVGSVEDDILSLKFNLKNDKTVIILLNSNDYKEVINGNNTSTTTILRNKVTNSEIRLYLHSKSSNIDYMKYIDEFWGNYDSKKEISVNNNTFYEYVVGKTVNYARLIDDNIILFIKSINGTIDIKDFVNIKVIDNSG